MLSVFGTCVRACVCMFCGRRLHYELFCGWVKIIWHTRRAHCLICTKWISQEMLLRLSSLVMRLGAGAKWCNELVCACNPPSENLIILISTMGALALVSNIRVALIQLYVVCKCCVFVCLYKTLCVVGVCACWDYTHTHTRTRRNNNTTTYTGIYL